MQFGNVTGVEFRVWDNRKHYIRFVGDVVAAGDKVRFVRLDQQGDPDRCSSADALTTSDALSAESTIVDHGGTVYECDSVGICKSNSICPDCNLGAGRWIDFRLDGDVDAQFPFTLNHISQT
eukprot:678198-Prymnesium_polylepis.1